MRMGQQILGQAGAEDVLGHRIHGQPRGGVGADHHEADVAERNQSRVADEDVETNDDDHSDEGLRCYPLQAGAAECPNQDHDDQQYQDER